MYDTSLTGFIGWDRLFKMCAAKLREQKDHAIDLGALHGCVGENKGHDFLFCFIFLCV